MSEDRLACVTGVTGLALIGFAPASSHATCHQFSRYLPGDAVISVSGGAALCAASVPGLDSDPVAVNGFHNTVGWGPTGRRLSEHLPASRPGRRPAGPPGPAREEVRQ